MDSAPSKCSRSIFANEENEFFWYEGLVKVLVCTSERYTHLLQLAIASLCKMWIGEKLNESNCCYSGGSIQRHGNCQLTTGKLLRSPNQRTQLGKWSLSCIRNSTYRFDSIRLRIFWVDNKNDHTPSSNKQQDPPVK